VVLYQKIKQKLINNTKSNIKSGVAPFGGAL